MFSHGQEMKISVPSASEIEAPLGGTTVVYNVSITEGSDNYIVTKTFREFEDLHKKLQRKYQNLSFPSLAKVSPDSNSRCKAADQFLTFVAAHCEIISVNLIKQFLGIDSEANYQITTTNPDPEIEEPEPLFKTVTPKKQVPKPVNPPPQEKDDLTHEFAASDKILNQQHGKTSFFDYEDEDDDDDLFKVTTKPKPQPQKQEPDLKPKKPAAVELFGSENLTSSIRDSNKEVNENKVIIPNKEEEILESKFDESELDESILNIEDDLDDLKNLSLTPKRVPVPKQESGLVADQQPKIKSKPIPPPKKPSLMKKPPLAPKPGTPKPSSDVTKNLDQLDINSYINAEEMANQQEAKLFD